MSMNPLNSIFKILPEMDQFHLQNTSLIKEHMSFLKKINCLKKKLTSLKDFLNCQNLSKTPKIFSKLAPSNKKNK